jgi:hypothetical protein
MDLRILPGSPVARLHSPVVFEEQLQLNGDKSEVMMMGTAFQLRRTVTMVSAVDIAGCLLLVSTKLKSLGVIFDSHLRFDVHASAVAEACNYHTLRALAPCPWCAV